MITRIYLKFVQLTNSTLGVLFYFSERVGLLKKVDVEIFKEIPGIMKVDLPYPANFDPKDKEHFSHNTGYDTYELSVYKVRDANISSKGIVFKGMNNCGFSFPHIGFRAQYAWLYLMGQYWFHKKQMGDPTKTYIVLFDFWSSNNYYHWLVDSCPRILMLKEELKEKNASLLLPETCGKYVLNILKHFEVNEITFIKKDSFFHAPDLLLPYYTVGSGHIHPGYVNKVREQILNSVSTSLNKERIYVSRSKQKVRRIHNEKEVIDTLLPLGFEVVYFEDMSFEQQVSTVRNAKILVTSHGANMTNAMFMPENTRVLEFLRFDRPNFCYWALASVTNKKYYYQFSKVVNHDDLLVDIEQFKINLQKLLND